MTTQIITNQSLVFQLQEHIEYSRAGVISKVIVQDQACQYTLFCLAANTEITKHSSTRNATINILEGRGLLTLSGKDINLNPGIFVFMPANAPHCLKAEENLAFILTFSEKSTEK